MREARDYKTDTRQAPCLPTELRPVRAAVLSYNRGSPPRLERAWECFAQKSVSDPSFTSLVVPESPATLSDKEISSWTGSQQYHICIHEYCQLLATGYNFHLALLTTRPQPRVVPASERAVIPLGAGG